MEHSLSLATLRPSTTRLLDMLHSIAILQGPRIRLPAFKRFTLTLAAPTLPQGRLHYSRTPPAHTTSPMEMGPSRITPLATVTRPLVITRSLRTQRALA